MAPPKNPQHSLSRGSSVSGFSRGSSIEMSEISEKNTRLPMDEVPTTSESDTDNQSLYLKLAGTHNSIPHSNHMPTETPMSPRASPSQVVPLDKIKNAKWYTGWDVIFSMLVCFFGCKSLKF